MHTEAMGIADLNIGNQTDAPFAGRRKCFSEKKDAHPGWGRASCAYLSAPTAGLAQQLENALRNLVGLGQHGLGGLHQNVVLGQRLGWTDFLWYRL